MENYTIIQNSDITSYLSDKGFRLYSLLQSMCYGSKISCFPSEKYLATALRCSTRTIQRALKELKKFGLISIRRRGTISNLYTMLQKKFTQMIEKVKETVNNVKKAYSESKTYAKTTKYPKKESVWNYSGQRTYDFSELEKHLLE